MRQSKLMVDLTAAKSRAVILAFFPFMKPLIERITGKDIRDRPCHDYFTDFTEALYRQRTQETGGVKQKEITYEQIKKLHYLDQLIAETLRIYPPTARLNRLCKKRTTIHGITLEHGTIVTIPVYAIHHDAELYPEPEKFDPDRFTAEEKARRHPLAYLPWGYGPRNCLGMRIAYFEMRIALVVLLKKYRFVPVEGAPGLPLEVDTKALTNSVHTLTVRAERR